MPKSSSRHNLLKPRAAVANKPLIKVRAMACARQQQATETLRMIHPQLFSHRLIGSIARTLLALLFGLSTQILWAQTLSDSHQTPPPNVGSSLGEPERSPEINFTYDWVSRDALTPQQQNTLNPACAGTYIDPMATEETVDPAVSPIYLDAGRVKMNQDNTIHLEDSVNIEQGDRRISAGSMYFNQNTEQASFKGGVHIRQKGLSLFGQSADINMAGEQGQFVDGQFVTHENHMRGQASLVEQTNKRAIILKEGAITSCEPGDNSWLLKGEKITLDSDKGMGYGRHVQIQLAGVPIFYTPYIAFPLSDKNQSGLLMPSFGTNERGVDLAQPIYWSIAPNFDATFTPRFASGHGSMFETEVRHMSELSYNEIALGYIPSDQGDDDPDLNNLLDLDNPEVNANARQRQYANQDRWLASWQHQGGDGKLWYSDIRIQKASDIDYLRDLEPASFDTTSNTYLQQAVTLGLRLPQWHISAQLQAYQNLLLDLDNSYRQLPLIAANGHYRWQDISLYLNHEYAYFDHEDQFYLNNSPVVTGERGRIHYALNWNKRSHWGFFKPEIGIQGLSYILDDDNLRSGVNDRPSLATSYASLDTGLVFERSNGRQTLEPRLYYLYRDFTDHSSLFNVTEDGQNINFDTSLLTFSYQQLFRSQRYAGGDRLADAHRLTAGLSYRWFDETGANRLNMSVGQLFYFDDRSITLNDKADTLKESDLAFQIQAPITHHLDASSDFLYNPDTSQIIRSTLRLNYVQNKNANQQRLFSLGYRFVREQEQALFAVGQTIDQIDVATVLPINAQWRIMSRIFYDLDRKKELDAFAGFEYESCCYNLRFLARRWLDSKLADLVKDNRARYDEGLFLEIELKGLGSSSKRIHGLLRDSILGFRE